MSTEVDIKVPLAEVQAACINVRRRSGHARGARTSSLFDSAKNAGRLGLLVFACAWLLGGLGWVSMGYFWLLVAAGCALSILAAVLFVVRLREFAPDVDLRKLEIVEGVLEAFRDRIHPTDTIRLHLDFRPDWEELFVEHKSGSDHCSNHWLHLGYTRRNGAIVVVGITAHTERTAIEDDNDDRTVIRQRVHERLKIGMVLPGDDLFGAAAVPPIEIAAEPGLTLREIDVQSKAVVFLFDTDEIESEWRVGERRRGQERPRLDSDLVVRQVRACLASVAGIRTFSQPDLPFSNVIPPEARLLKPTIGDRWRAFRAWCARRWYRWRTTPEERHQAMVRTVGQEVAQILVDDLHPTDSGLCEDDREWLIASAVANAFEQLGNDMIVARAGFCMTGPDRTLFSSIVSERLRQLLERLAAARTRAIPTLSWSARREPFPDDLNIRCIPVYADGGGWIGVEGESVRRVGPASEDIADVPVNLDVNRCACIAHDPGRDVLAIWQRGWAWTPSRTFFYDKATQTWQEHTHEYRSEDEYGGVSFLFDHKRDCFVRIGLTYNAVWTSEQAYSERPVGPVQLAAGEDGLVAVSDAASGQTLVVDVQEDRVFRVAPAGWSLVARLTRPAGFEPHKAVWSLSAGAVRYDARARRLICSRGYGAYEDYCLELGPAFDAAVHLDAADRG